jgi:hypothetical protein
MFKARSIIAGAAAAVLAVTLGACSSGEDSDSSGTSSSQTSFTPKDEADPGDDLLGRIRLGMKFAGTPLKASWKFPTSYEPAAGDNTRAYTADDHYRITIQAGPGDQDRAAAAMANAQSQAEAKGQQTSLDTVSVKAREFAVLVQDTPDGGIITYAHSPDGGPKFYIIQFATDIPLADVPQKQLDGFLQTLGSLEFEQAGPPPGL